MLQKYVSKTSSQWGKPDSVIKIAEGIYLISTPSHGGYFVELDKYETMPQIYKDCSYTKNQYFEEDCSWCGVVLAFKDCFSEDDYACAHRTFEKFYTNKKIT